jgi:hypothetical protein
VKAEAKTGAMNQTANRAAKGRCSFERTFQARLVDYCFLCVRHVWDGARHSELADGLVLAETIHGARSMTKPGIDPDEAVADAFGNCPVCGADLDMRDLGQFGLYMHDQEIEISEGPMKQPDKRPTEANSGRYGTGLRVRKPHHESGANRFPNSYSA